MIIRLHSDNFFRGYGPNCENTNIKLRLFLPVLTLHSEHFTAMINLLQLPMISSNFALNLTTSKCISLIQ